MSVNTLKMAALLAAGMGAAMGDAEVVRHGESPSMPYYNIGTPSRGSSGNNRSPGPTRAEKKHKRKIARASRRYNLRNGA